MAVLYEWIGDVSSRGNLLHIIVKGLSFVVAKFNLVTEGLAAAWVLFCPHVSMLLSKLMV